MGIPFIKHKHKKHGCASILDDDETHGSDEKIWVASLFVFHFVHLT